MDSLNNAQIRPIELSDSHRYAELRNALDRETPFWGADPGIRFGHEEEAEQFVQNILNEPRSKLFVVEHRNELVGFLLVTAQKWRRNSTGVVDVGVRASHFRQGLGSKLFGELFDWAPTVGLTRLELLVMTTNASGIALYKKHGFKIEGTKLQSIVVNGIPTDELLMARLLKCDARNFPSSSLG